MADPRFYDNRGPFTLAEVCARARATCRPDGRRPGEAIADLASFGGRRPATSDILRREGPKRTRRSQAGWCFVGRRGDIRDRAVGPPLIVCPSVQHAFAAAALLFYPEHGSERWDAGASRSTLRAKLGRECPLAPGVVIGPGAEIGAGTRIGPNAVIGRGVAIGRDCEIGSHVGIALRLSWRSTFVLSRRADRPAGFRFRRFGARPHQNPAARPRHRSGQGRDRRLHHYRSRRPWRHGDRRRNQN